MRIGLIAMFAAACSSVWPSGALLATASAPTDCDAPGTFSITTGLPSAAANLSAMMRATRSLGPPVVTGTMIRTGFDGYPACGHAAWLTSVNSSTIKRRIAISSGYFGAVLAQQFLEQRA